MPHLYKKSSAAKVWRFQLRDPTGRVRDFKGFASKAATESEAQRMADHFLRVKRGIHDPHAEAYAKAEATPLAKHLEDWRRHIVSNGSSQAHADLLHFRVARIFDLGDAGKGYARISQLNAVEVQNIIAAMLDELAQQTANHVIQSCKQFSLWLHAHDRAAEHKLRSLKKYALTKIERNRINLPWGDVAKMIQHVESSPNPQGGRFKLSRRDRGMLYRLAAATGFRRRALASLTPESFDLSSGAATVTCLPGYWKSKKTVVQPLPESLAELLREYLVGKPAGVRLWRIPSHTAHMIRADFRNAGVAFPDDGMARDFHCLRHTAITSWIEGGADLKTVQELAGHSVITLTQRYAHTTPDHKRRAVDALPPIPRKEKP